MIILGSNDAYYEGFTQNDLDFRMQKTGASMEEYKAFAKEQVLDFTDEQKKIIDEHMERIEEVIAEKGYSKRAVITGLYKLSLLLPKEEI